ncbi:Cathepsin D [Schistosoma japonicum]|uniref:Cathepsin D n=1 Tax=Schistosoma japonicum TaxID=6182 RepID=A0A4Z2DHJ1_SCHJA|nr:Cathepsin D [Schistosoma japonicum]
MCPSLSGVSREHSELKRLRSHVSLITCFTLSICSAAYMYKLVDEIIIDCETDLVDGCFTEDYNKEKNQPTNSQLKAVLDQRGVLYSSVRERTDIERAINSTGFVTANELASAKAEQLKFASKNFSNSPDALLYRKLVDCSHKTVKWNYASSSLKPNSIVFDSESEFIEHVEDKKDSVWLLAVASPHSLPSPTTGDHESTSSLRIKPASVVTEEIWSVLSYRYQSFGFKTGLLNCEKLQSCGLIKNMKNLMRRLTSNNSHSRRLSRLNPILVRERLNQIPPDQLWDELSRLIIQSDIELRSESESRYHRSCNNQSKSTNESLLSNIGLPQINYGENAEVVEDLYHQGNGENDDLLNHKTAAHMYTWNCLRSLGNNNSNTVRSNVGVNPSQYRSHTRKSFSVTKQPTNHVMDTSYEAEDECEDPTGDDDKRSVPKISSFIRRRHRAHLHSHLHSNRLSHPITSSSNSSSTSDPNNSDREPYLGNSSVPSREISKRTNLISTSSVLSTSSSSSYISSNDSLIRIRDYNVFNHATFLIRPRDVHSKLVGFIDHVFSNYIISIKDKIFCPPGSTALIDTGTALLLGPTEAIDNINRYLGSVRQSTMEYNVDCNKIHELPPIDIKINGKSIQLKPDDYIAERVSNTSRICRTCFIGADFPTGPLWIFGDVFLRKVYTIFDVGQHRIGFADAIANVKAL